MDYNTYSTSYGAQGGAGGGGFMPGSQSDSPSAGKRSYGKDTLRPVTIKQLLDAQHPHPDAEYFIIDGAECTQVTFVGQIRNISTQTTNVTYKLDDGTGIIEVKVWIDTDTFNDPDHPGNQKPKPVEQGYARCWGRLKAFNNKRHVGANIIRPLADYNEIQYHLLEATVVHLHFIKGPLTELQQANQQLKQGGAGMNGGGYGQYDGAAGAGDVGQGGARQIPAGISRSAKQVYSTLLNAPQTHEGLHVQEIASRANMEMAEVLKGAEELTGAGMLYTTVDDQTWAILDV